ncbi:hypothetical protein MKW92_009814 [Papaver armeniacum]|nr:hypothetical protein MKW92_009814 [Papaver armeniacum]
MEKCVSVKKNINLRVNIQWLNSIYLLLLFLPYVSVKSDNDEIAALKTLAIEIGAWALSFAFVIIIIVIIRYIIRWVWFLYALIRIIITIIREANRKRGLDMKVIEMFPVFRYPDVKNIENELECVVCLSQFEDGDMLRILPCKHVFHTTECIDRWLVFKSSTCPVCHFDLNVPESTPNAGGIIIDVSEAGKDHIEMATI